MNSRFVKDSVLDNPTKIKGCLRAQDWWPAGLAVLGWGAAIWLAGCAPVGPAYQPPRPALPAAWSGEPVAEAAQPAGREVLARWWTLFGDPRLDSLIERAVAANQDLKIAEARILQARAQYRLTTAAAAPALDLSGSYANSRQSENVGNGGGNSHDLFQAGFDAGWELDIFGGARRAGEAAAARLAAARENRHDVLVTLAAEVARNYLELRGSQQRLLAARASLAGQAETLALAKGRREAGLGNELEVAQAETQLALTRAQLPPLENSGGQAIYRLALLLGLAPRELTGELAGPAPLPTGLVRLPENLPSELLRRRPDIRRVERLLAAATAEVGVATAELFPRFSLTGLAGLQSLNLSDLLTAASRYWTVGPTLRWALFDGGRVRANIDLNQGRRAEAQLLYEKTVLAALGEVEVALLALAREEESRQALAGAVDSGQRSVAQAAGRYRAGLAGVLEVLLGERALYQSQDQLLQSEQRRGVALVALCKALGGGWEEGAGWSEPPGGAAAELPPLPPSTPTGDLKK